MVNSKKILYSKGGNDEYKTPAYAVAPLIPYIKPSSIVWCPFDTEESDFVKLIRNAGCVVIASHIRAGKDFFEYEPDRWDVLISNPPFSNKRKFFERALSFNKPFALLMSNTWLNDSAPKKLFEHKDLQLLMFDKRVKFENEQGVTNRKITFSSSYFCYDFLPKNI